MKRAFIFLAVVSLLPCWLSGQGDYQKGVSYFQQGQYSKAITEFESIVKEQPDYESGHRLLGLAYLKTGQFDRAIQAFQRSTELKKDVFVSHVGLALAYFNSGRYQPALEALEPAEPLARSPKDQYQVFHIRGSAAFNLKRFKLAAESLEAAVSIQRGDASDLLQLGISYYKLGELDPAEKNLQQVLALDPANSEASEFLTRVKSDRALAAIESGNYQSATTSLREIVERNPEDADAWFNLGLAYLFSENLSAAEESFRRNTRLSPENSESYDRLGYIYEKRGQHKKALDAYQKAFELKADPTVKESVERIKRRIAQAGQAG